ncbi:hypothetical protein WR25_26787 [Diploscapter pachys]|uniref:Uncharacterized protein n=1 Tax=Diploscapter pachys TaxID=2018661 RepID=A0A2A2LHY6_9BILA|nr:hypothetical protein WR25_26787 [Diploscapter pachys]
MPFTSKKRNKRSPRHLLANAYANPLHVAVPIESSASGKDKKNNEPQTTQTPTMRTPQPELGELRTPPVDENEPVVKSVKVAMQNSMNAEQTPASSLVAITSPNAHKVILIG